MNAVGFHVLLVAMLPLFLLHQLYLLPPNWLCDRIRAKWQNSERAETVRLWVKIGWPLLILAIMVALNAVLLTQLLSG